MFIFFDMISDVQKIVNKKRREEMGQIHVSDGKVSGGKGGAIVIGIIAAIATSIFYFVAPGEDFYLTTGERVIHLFLSLLNIPIAILGQKIGRFIDDLRHKAAGEDTASVLISRDLTGIVIQKFLGALLGVLIFEVILFVLFCSPTKISAKEQEQMFVEQQQERAIAIQEIGEPKPAVLETRIPISREEFMQQYVNVEFEECDISRLEGMLKRGSKNLKVTGKLDINFYIEGDLLNDVYLDLTDLEYFDAWGNSVLDNDFSLYNAKCIILPKHITQITDAFQNSRNLEILVLNEELVEISGLLGSKIKYVYLPKTLKRIGKAFVGSPIEKIIIPASVEEITSFEDCQQLTEIFFEAGSQIKVLPSFSDCPNLRTISLPDSVEEIPMIGFSGCRNLEEIKISSNSQLSEIGSGAFDRTSLTSLYVPPKVSVFPNLIFYNFLAVTFASTTPPKGVNENTFEDGVIEKIYVPSQSLKEYEDAWFNYDWAINAQFIAISE
jgi:hypothetical protein